jgi:hypothetical protein
MPAENEPSTISLLNLNEGAAVLKFDDALAKMLKNIADPNFKAMAKRTITLTVDLYPDEDRIGLASKVSCGTSTPKNLPAVSRMYVGKGDDGRLYALTSDPRQMNIFNPPAPKPVPAPLEFKSFNS